MPGSGMNGYFKRCFAGMAGCMKSSTAHGVNHVANSGHPIIRTFWLMAFGTGSAIFLLHFYTLLQRFFSNPVSITIDYRAVEFTFPDVTFCSFLPFSIRVFEQMNLLPRLRNITDWKSKELEDMIQSARLPMDNFILECTFHDIPCNLQKDFRVIEDPRYKHCFTFTPGERKAMSTVPQQGLSVVLFTENVHPHTLEMDVNFQIPSEWQSAGVRVAVHPPGSLPHPETRGVDVASGTSALVGLTISRTMQIKDCEHRSSITLCDVHKQERQTAFTFTKEDCYSEQIQMRMIDHCKCLSDEFELPAKFCRSNRSGDIDNMHFTPICNSEEQKLCHKEMLTRINKNFNELVISHCPYMCKDTHWHVNVYSTTWPSHFAEKQVSRIFEDVHKRLTKLNKTSYLGDYSDDVHFDKTEKLVQNLAHILVYPTMLTGTEAKQEVAYPLESLLSEVGGILGLWLGCSVLTFFEPVELLLHTITPCCMRHVDKLQKRTERLRSAVHERATSMRVRSSRSSALKRNANEQNQPSLLPQPAPDDEADKDRRKSRSRIKFDDQDEHDNSTSDPAKLADTVITLDEDQVEMVVLPDGELA